MSENKQPFENEDENEPEIWDEHRWEAFFKESDKRTDQYSALLDKYMDHPDRDSIIAEKMGWLHLLDDIEDEKEQWMDDIFSDEFENGEEWKRGTGYEPTNFDSLESLPVYQKTFNFTIDAMDLIDEHLSNVDDEAVSEFARNVTIPAAKIAGGFGFGFEIDCIGGNIANCKRGLKSANKVLSALHQIGEKELLDKEIFITFYGRAKEVRDEMAIYIVELRERFRRGIY